jgi:hypothetical protein
MNQSQEKLDPHLVQLVLSLQAGAMQQLGKIASPISGKVERNLEMARHTIDMLDMLNSKMAGNLTEQEQQLIQHALYELRMNFVEESGKDTDSEQSKDSDDGQQQPSDNQSEPVTEPEEPGESELDRPGQE